MRIRYLVGTAMALMALTGCATETGGPGEPQAGSNRPTESAQAASVEETVEEPSPEPTEAGPIKFGQTFTYENDVSVTVSAPTPYEPSESAFMSEGFPEAVSFQVTVVNGGTTNYDPSMFMTTVQSGNVEAEEIFDSANGMEGSPSTAVLPGREVTFPIAYAVTNPADLVMEAAPGFEYDSAIFVS